MSLTLKEKTVMKTWELRHKFNSSVRKFGNKLPIFESEHPTKCRYGLGDLLTAEVNFQRAGTVIGTGLAMTTALGASSAIWAIANETYGWSRHLGHFMAFVSLGVFSVFPGLWFVVGGSLIGKKLDKKLGDTSIGSRQWIREIKDTHGTTEKDKIL